MSGSGESSGPTFANPVEKFEESFMSCLSALTKEDTLTNVDRDEIRADVEQGIFNVIESARTMESYFLKKRQEIAAQKPELPIKDESNELRLEMMRKDELLKKNYDKINHWQNILSDAQTAGKQSGGPGINQNQSTNIPGNHQGGLNQCGPMSQGPMSVGPMSQGPMSVGPMSQGPHTPMSVGPMSQGPMTPTGGGRPNTPAGRPQTPGGMGGPRMQGGNIGFSPSMHQQPIGSPQLGGLGMGGGTGHGLQGPLAYLEKSRKQQGPICGSHETQFDSEFATFATDMHFPTPDVPSKPKANVSKIVKPRKPRTKNANKDNIEKKNIKQSSRTMKGKPRDDKIAVSSTSDEPKQKPKKRTKNSNAKEGDPKPRSRKKQ